MSENKTTGTPLPDEKLQDLVASTDTGRWPHTGFPLKVILGVAAFWSLFQIWIASPLPFVVAETTGLQVVLNDTGTRAIHLGLAILLASLAHG